MIFDTAQITSSILVGGVEVLALLVKKKSRLTAQGRLRRQGKIDTGGPLRGPPVSRKERNPSHGQPSSRGRILEGWWELLGLEPFVF